MPRSVSGAPPPRNRDEIKPSLLRPPERFFPSTSDFSGRSRVISSRETEVVKRRVGVVGLYFFIGMVKCSPLNLGVFRHLLAGLQRDVRFLPIRTITGGSPVAAQFTNLVRRSPVSHFHLEQLLHCGFHHSF